MFPLPELDSQSDLPLYRQLAAYVKDLILAGRLERGERLPATRELAGLLRLNRTTISAAYELLESEGLIRGHVGRGSFVDGPAGAGFAGGLDWEQILPGSRGLPAAVPGPGEAPGLISFSTSRPSEELFPIDEFRAICAEVVGSGEIGAILQLGSPGGFTPLRRYLLEQAAAEGTAGAHDDVIITNGCQQAIDLLARVLVRGGDSVLLEDPVYPGLKNVFEQAGARLTGIPMTTQGLDLQILERSLAQERPRVLVITSTFQNPTGATLPLAARQAILRMAREAGAVLIENDIYGPLRYEGEEIPTLKQLDETGCTVLLRSFSKIAFPGLRVGWAIAPRPLAARLAEAKQACDLHSDQLSQAVLLRFAESGRLRAHRDRIVEAGAERLRAVLAACERYLPVGSTFTRPQGGMNLWVRLPEPLDAGELLPRAQREGVAYLPGRYFSISRYEPGSLRLSFAGLTPEQIGQGLAQLGEIFHRELDRVRTARRFEPAPAMV
ncbi:MAG: PLP-dependent aminotransferase family protein [Bryobacteraceae bacterium]